MKKNLERGLLEKGKPGKLIPENKNFKGEKPGEKSRGEINSGGIFR
jgi:hypothetical protein